MIIKTKTHIDSAHKLELKYESKCTRLHGHRWEIYIEIEGEVNEVGMVADFAAIKAYINEYDHCYLNEKVDFNPTAENLAEFWAKEVSRIFLLKRVKIKVAETPNNYAEYEVKNDI